MRDRTAPRCGRHRGNKCGFLEEAASWDGRAILWNRDTVRGKLRQALLDGIGGVYSSEDACAGDPASLAPASVPADIDVSEGTPSCMKVHLYCLGKADDPFDPSDDPVEPVEPAEPAEAEQGCQLGASAPAARGAWWLLGLGAAIWARRRIR